MLVLSRPARIESDPQRLDAEYRSAHWLHHRLLDFEDEHQEVLDKAAELAAPGVVRVGRILTRLARRAKRRERSTSGAWSPNPHPELAAALKVKLAELRAVRNADLRWKAALGWADEQVGEPKVLRRRKAKPPEKVKRRKGETDEAFEKRFELLTHDESDEHFAAKVASARRDTRRDVYRKALYRERRCYWGTWNAVLKSVDDARKAVLKNRSAGLPAEWRRPRWSDSRTIASDGSGVRIVESAKPWVTLEMRIGVDADWVRFRAKIGNCRPVPPDARIVACQLTRKRDGARWVHQVSLTVDGMSANTEGFATGGTVAFDWGHREHGHDGAKQGMRVFTWLGDDGATGEVLLPVECRHLLDAIDEDKRRLDDAFNARKSTLDLPERNRHGYRRRLMRLGVRTEEEHCWLKWETRYERRLARSRKRITNLRKEVYLQAVRALRSKYAIFAFEGESVARLKTKAKDDHGPRRQRSNRDLAARYEFVSLCERLGAEVITVTSRNSTRECPDCGHLCENGPELLVTCVGCGRTRDKDHGATRVIMRRAQEALASGVANG